jgi:hypothetical protein
MDGSQIDWHIETIAQVTEPIADTEQQHSKVTKKVRPKYVRRKNNT